MEAVKLSGEWLWPPAEDVDALVEASAAGNAVESVIRMRALTEIARRMSTADLLRLAARLEVPQAAPRAKA
jgi:hypothetical protein